MRERFYAGPSYIGAERFRRSGYQSPTLTALVWLFTWAVRFFTLPGRVVVLCTGVLMLYSLMTLDMPVYLLGFAMLTVILADIVVGTLTRPKLGVVRHVPPAIGVDADVRIAYTVTNRRDRPAWSVHVDSLPLPGHLSFIRGVPFIETLAPRETVTVTADIRARRRGKYTLPAVLSDTSFPFNLCRSGSLSGRPQRLLVYPRFAPLTRLDLPVGRSYQPGGVSLTSNVADSMEFFGCREYRDGDNPHHIHWRSWARTGYPVVKEFREEYLPRTALILDTGRPRRFADIMGLDREDTLFEAGISLAAAVSDFFSRQEYVVDLFAAGPQVYRFQSGRSLGQLEDILDILACLEPHHGEPFERLSPEIVRDIARISSAVVVLLSWDSVRRDLVGALTKAGIELKVVYVADGTRAVAGHPPEATVVTSEQIRQGRCTVL